MHYTRPDSSNNTAPISKWFCDEYGYKPFWFKRQAYKVWGLPEDKLETFLLGNTNAIVFFIWVVYVLYFVCEGWWLPVMDLPAPNLEDLMYFYELSDVE